MAECKKKPVKKAVGGMAIAPKIGSPGPLMPPIGISKTKRNVQPVVNVSASRPQLSPVPTSSGLKKGGKPVKKEK